MYLHVYMQMPPLPAKRGSPPARLDVVGYGMGFVSSYILKYLSGLDLEPPAGLVRPAKDPYRGKPANKRKRITAGAAAG